ncbi:MAG: CDP-alcohol phosphatidyltransferase family protein [Polyangiaceae bacterium]|nr:CDP-alcohol phosphatidyltransferase family protein [Polyangiaceae bacterium]
MGVSAEIYRKTRKTPDLLWNRWVCRPLAAPLVALVRNTPVTPNQITLAALGVATASAVMFAWCPGYWGLLAAALVFEFSYVLDCVDGMLARWRNTSSPVGHLLDFLMDELKAFQILAAVSCRLFLEQADVRYLLMGILGLVVLASGIAMTTFLRRPELASPSAPTERLPARPTWVRRAIGLAERLGKLLIHYPSYILLAALTGRIELYLYPYVIVNSLYALRALASIALRFGRFKNAHAAASVQTTAS